MATETIIQDRCRRCGAVESPDRVLWASVDLSAIVCGPCHDEFDAWADANPGRPFRAFLARKPKHRARPSLLTRRRNRQAEVEHHLWAAQGLDRPTYRGRHAAEVTA